MYKKIFTIFALMAVIVLFVNGSIFAIEMTDEYTVEPSNVNGSILDKLEFIQKYSLAIIPLFFIYALYLFFVQGAKLEEKKVMGKKLIIVLGLLLVLTQSLPLIYALMVFG